MMNPGMSYPSPYSGSSGGMSPMMSSAGPMMGGESPMMGGSDSPMMMEGPGMYGGGSPMQPGMGMYGQPGQYGGPEDSQIITRNGGPMMGGSSSASVSFFPFARIRPGPGLVIISSKDGQTANDDQTQPDTPNTNSTDTDTDTTSDDSSDSTIAPFAGWNDTDISGAVIGKEEVLTTVGPTTTSPVIVKAVPVVPVVAVLNVVASSTVGTVGSNTTKPSCTNPTYMNRNFMATALQMGLIAKNASCVVLVD